MATSSRRALVIAHEPDGPGGQVSVRLQDRGFEVHTHLVTTDYAKPNDSAPFPSTEGYDLVAIMGSVRSVTKKDEISNWVHDELDLIRTARENDQPVLGVCFGAQLIADALGGSVEVAPTTEIGWFEIEATAGSENPVGPGPWMEWHHDRFFAPPGADVLATTSSAEQLFTIGKMVGTQFHPEVDLQHVTDWLATADAEYLRQYDQDADAILETVRAQEDRNTKQCHALVDWFLDSVAFPPTAHLADQAAG